MGGHLQKLRLFVSAVGGIASDSSTGWTNETMLSTEKAEKLKRRWRSETLPNDPFDADHILSAIRVIVVILIAMARGQSLFGLRLQVGLW